jgi:DNA-binding beta-propeller fold protein YncE
MIQIKSKSARPRRLHLPLSLLSLLAVAACGSGGTDDATSGVRPIGPGVDGKADDGDEADAGTGGTPAEPETGGTPAEPETGGTPAEPETGGTPAEPEPVGVALLGAGTHSPDAVTFELIADERHGLRRPRALAFNPEHEGELWVVNQRDDSTVTFFDLHTDQPRLAKRVDPYALHFMDAPSSIAFGTPMTFATCQESRNTYNNQAPPNDFMGPTLWPADFDVYGRSNPEAVAFVGADLGSHIDMLHESPLCMGIAWEKDNIYWTFDGLSGSISRFDFMQDHGVGYDDHSDGVIWRYAAGEVGYVENVPSHLVYAADSGLLYIADTGNARIAVLNTTTGRSRGRLSPIEPGTQLWRMVDAELSTLADATTGELAQPSGLALHDGLLYVSDHATGRITAFALDGTRVDWLDTGLPAGGLMGIAFDAGGALYVLDGGDNRLLRLRAR